MEYKVGVVFVCYVVGVLVDDIVQVVVLFGVVHFVELLCEVVLVVKVFYVFGVFCLI